jgi:carboxymethylenebutenolidase
MDNQPGQAASVTLPSAKPIPLATNVTLQPPLSRCGKGPGLLILVSKEYKGVGEDIGSSTLDPEPLQKWAEEGFAVVEVRIGRTGSSENAQEAFDIGLDALRKSPECTFDDRVGVVGKLCFSIPEVVKHWWDSCSP